jgi:hypothetical protein
MRTQFDHTQRVVSLDNLHAMCARVSGWAHRYEVSKVSRSRIHVTYSNPDEYGNESPMAAVFPCYPSTFDGADNPAIVLDMIRVIADNWDGEGWQSFSQLLDCPVLWRNPTTGAWETETQINARMAQEDAERGRKETQA